MASSKEAAKDLQDRAAGRGPALVRRPSTGSGRRRRASPGKEDGCVKLLVEGAALPAACWICKVQVGQVGGIFQEHVQYASACEEAAHRQTTRQMSLLRVRGKAYGGDT